MKKFVASVDFYIYFDSCIKLSWHQVPLAQYVTDEEGLAKHIKCMYVYEYSCAGSIDESIKPCPSVVCSVANSLGLKKDR